MAMTKDLSLICEIPNFANVYLGKVIKFQGYGLFRLGILGNLLVWRWKTPWPQIRIGSILWLLGHKLPIKICDDVLKYLNLKNILNI